MNRRRFLLAGTAALGAQAAQTMLAGVVPASRTRGGADAVKAYWENCGEAGALGFHRIEVNDTRARIAEAYADRVSEFRDEMAKRRVSLAGLALFSHMGWSAEWKELADRHMLLGKFLAATGGKYVAHMLAPAAILNEAADDSAYGEVDVKTWATQASEIGKRLYEEWGVRLGYHPERAEVKSGLYARMLEAADSRYFHFLPDTGHLAAGGADAVEVCRKYHARLIGVHLKDFSPAPGAGKILKAGNVPFGGGTVDLKGVVEELRKRRFSGFAMGESGGTNETMRDYMSRQLGLEL